MTSPNCKFKKKKIIFIYPPKNWFYGIDYANSEKIVKYLRNNKIFKIFEFKEIDLFLKENLKLKDFLRLIYIYFFYKIKNPSYVFAINASYIAYCNLIFKKRFINFFSQILKLKCILKWDHMNQQVPNIVENILNKTQIYNVNDYKKFFLENINNKNFQHYTWQKSEYFCKKNYLEDTLELKNLKLKCLNFVFTSKEIIKNFSLTIDENNKLIGLIGYLNQFSKPKIVPDDVQFLLQEKKNYFNKDHYRNLISYSSYIYSKNKIELLKIKDVNFYGVNLIKNYGKVVNSDDFFSQISKFFIIVNPLNPISLTITSKFYLIYLNGGFCINELPSEIPPKLEKFKKFIFYKNKKELIEKIEFFKNNLSVYFSIKKEIYEISKNFKTHSLTVFTEEFLKH